MCPSRVGDRWTETDIQRVFWSDLQSLRQKYIFHPLQSLELNSHTFPVFPSLKIKFLPLILPFRTAPKSEVFSCI